MRLTLLGPPGSGKGTQAAALGRHFDVPVISSGELLRGRVAGDAGEWHDVATRLARGALVPDDVVLGVVDDALRGRVASGGYVLDGFPRTRAQAAHPAAPTIDAAVDLALPDDVARERLRGRVAEGRDDDADTRAIERRIEAFHSETEPLLDLYRSRGLLVTVDAAESPGAVSAAIMAAVTAREEA